MTEFPMLATNDWSVLFITLAIILVGSVCAAIYFWLRRAQYDEAVREIKKWAVQNQYELLTLKKSWWLTSPFLLKRTSMQQLFWIEVKTEKLEMKKGWGRIGGIFGGLTSSSVSVEWDWP
jgi:hypothetical protein